VPGRGAGWGCPRSETPSYSQVNEEETQYWCGSGQETRCRGQSIKLRRRLTDFYFILSVLGSDLSSSQSTGGLRWHLSRGRYLLRRTTSILAESAWATVGIMQVACLSQAGFREGAVQVKPTVSAQEELNYGNVSTKV